MFRPMLAVAALAVACAAAPLDREFVPSPSAQLPVPRFVVVEDGVRDWLAYEWDAHLTDWPMIERARCLRWDIVPFAGETAYRVYAAGMPDTIRKAAQGGVNFSCPKVPNTATVHTHHPQTCESITGPCLRGGLYAWQCFASDRDRDYVRRMGHAFGMVQCDRNALIFFFAQPR